MLTNFYSKAEFLNTVKLWQEQMDYYSVKTMPGTYPDALEYAKNPGKVTVETWDELKGAHRQTGVKADMVLHRSFVLDKDNKISEILYYGNPEVSYEIGRGYGERTNGTIYNQHENINKLRLMMAAAEHGDMEKYYGYFDKDATFWDINNMDGKPHNLEAEKAADKAVLDLYEFVSIVQTGYPDFMKYEIGGGGGTLYSWWNINLRRKSDKKVVKVPFHYDHTVNKDGKIVNTISYYNAALLK